jgi:hypothetical protein
MLEIIKHQIKKQSLLTKCLLASLGFHFLLFLFLYKNPLILQGPFRSFFNRTSPTPQILTAEQSDQNVDEKNSYLEEAFQMLATPSSTLKQPFDTLYNPHENASVPKLETLTSLPVLETKEPLCQIDTSLKSNSSNLDIEFSLPSSLETPDIAPEELSFLPQISINKQTAPIDNEALAASNELNIEQGSIEPFEQNLFEKEFAAELSPEFPSDLQPLAIPPAKDFPHPSVNQHYALTKENIENLTPNKELPPYRPLILPRPNISQSTTSLSNTSHHLPELESYLFPEIAEALSWDEQFDVKLQIMPQPDKKNFIFSVTVHPNEELNVEAIPQNFYFLIDRSNSIEKFRFGVYKRAVLKALSYLPEDATFNIIVFDKKISSLSKKNLNATKQSFQLAEDFLDKQQHGGMFTTADVYSSLEKIIPESLPENEINTAILITDGQSRLSPSKQKQYINQWIKKNQGKVSLYAATAGRGNNLLLLDLLSTYNGGHLLYSDTNSAFPRRLCKLLLTLRDPIAKNLIISALPAEQEAEIHFFPEATHLPNFYLNQPYEIIGSMNLLSNFTLLIQGKYKDHWVTIKKEISFKSAEKATATLRKKWSHMQAKNHYHQFLKEGKISSLNKAKSILKSCGSEIACE